MLLDIQYEHFLKKFLPEPRNDNQLILDRSSSEYFLAALV